MMETRQHALDAGGRMLRKSVNVVALAVAMIVIVAMPLSYGTIGYRYEAAIANSQATQYAQRLASFVYQYPELWQFQKVRISELIDFGVGQDGSRSRVLDKLGRTVVAEGDLSTPFKVVGRAPIVVSGATIGFVESVFPLDPLAREVGLVSIAALLLGCLSYISVRLLPLRVIDRTLSDLQVANRIVKRNNEALAAQNKALQNTKEALKKRTDQLIEAQLIGGIGDWSFRIGEPTIYMSPELHKLLRIGIAGCLCDRDAILSCMVGSDAERIHLSQEEVSKTGEPRSIDIKMRRGDGSIGDFVLVSKAEISPEGAVFGFRGTIQDITERKQAEERLQQLAYFDTLTGLPNRTLFRRRAEEALERYHAERREMSIMLLDLDRFKEVNDSLGHSVGDELLGRIADIISGILGNKHLLARLGGDEFGIIVSDGLDRAELEKMALNVIGAVAKPIVLGRGDVVIGTSIGIATVPKDAVSIGELLQNADLALHRAKESGRGRYKFFAPEMAAAVQHTLKLERDLRHAISDNCGLEVHFQPQVDIQANRVVAFEALMRWTHPTLGNIAPGEFIPIAERSRLICDLGLWMLREAVRQAKAWIDNGEEPRQVAVNVSASQILHTDFVKDVCDALHETGLPPNLLCLELTESLLVDHAEGCVRKVLMELKRVGVILALDDFGTDYSSLGYLVQLPFDKLKIDRIFINGIAESDRVRSLVQGIVALGRGLRMQTVMEGVERTDELRIISMLGCDIVQGFVFARPSPADQAMAFAREFDDLGCRSMTA